MIFITVIVFLFVFFNIFLYFSPSYSLPILFIIHSKSTYECMSCKNIVEKLENPNTQQVTINRAFDLNSFDI